MWSVCNTVISVLVLVSSSSVWVMDSDSVKVATRDSLLASSDKHFISWTNKSRAFFCSVEETDSSLSKIFSKLSITNDKRITAVPSGRNWNENGEEHSKLCHTLSIQIEFWNWSLFFPSIVIDNWFKLWSFANCCQRQFWEIQFYWEIVFYGNVFTTEVFQYQDYDPLTNFTTSVNTKWPPNASHRKTNNSLLNKMDASEARNTGHVDKVYRISANWSLVFDLSRRIG